MPIKIKTTKQARQIRAGILLARGLSTPDTLKDGNSKLAGKAYHETLYRKYHRYAEGMRNRGVWYEIGLKPPPGDYPPPPDFRF
jgi:hypothetical protein